MNQIAKTTLEQLGGKNKLQYLIGAKNFISNEQGDLEFQFEMCSKANCVTFLLDPSDTYTMIFSIKNSKGKHEVDSFNNLYFDMLIPTFEQFTGLYLYFK